MSETKKNNSENKDVDVTASLISAVSQGNLKSVKTLVHSHGLSYCECGNGGYVPLFVAIKLKHIDIAKFLLEQGVKAHSNTDLIDTPLHLASRKGYVELVQLLLQKIQLVDVRNDKNETPLHLAAREGYIQIVEMLLNKNACVMSQTKKGLTPFTLAVDGRHEEVVQSLLRHAFAKKSVGQKNSTLFYNTLLCNFINWDRVNSLVLEIVIQDVCTSEIIDEIIDHGFNLNPHYVNASLLVAAAEKNYVKLIDSILSIGAYTSNRRHSPLILHTAVINGHKELVELFLKAGFCADAKDTENKTCLYQSLNCGQELKSIGIVQLLLASGADVKKAPELLHKAVNKSFFRICKILVENHANVNARNSDDETPLYCAVSRKQDNEMISNHIIKLLLNNGADVNIYVGDFTAFHGAILHGRKEAVSIFLEFGVDVDLCTKDGSTPLYMASWTGHSEIVEILCKSNAVMNQGQSVDKTPLYNAVKVKRSARVVETLLKFGADIDFNFHDPVSHSNRDDDFNEKWDEYNKVAGILKKHIIKMNVAGLNVSEPNTHLNYELFSNFKQDCEEELIRLKNEKIGSQFTLFDIFLNGKKPSYAKNKSLMQILKSFNFDHFPIYKDLLTGNLEVSQSRLTLLQSGQRTLDALIKITSKLNGNQYSVLPVEILEEIVSYLSYRDVKCLVYCGKALKRQLKL